MNETCLLYSSVLLWDFAVLLLLMLVLMLLPPFFCSRIVCIFSIFIAFAWNVIPFYGLYNPKSFSVATFLKHFHYLYFICTEQTERWHLLKFCAFSFPPTAMAVRMRFAFLYSHLFFYPFFKGCKCESYFAGDNDARRYCACVCVRSVIKIPQNIKWNAIFFERRIK